MTIPRKAPVAHNNSKEFVPMPYNEGLETVMGLQSLFEHFNHSLRQVVINNSLSIVYREFSFKIKQIRSFLNRLV